MAYDPIVLPRGLAKPSHQDETGLIYLCMRLDFYWKEHDVCPNGAWCMLISRGAIKRTGGCAQSRSAGEELDRVARVS